MNWLPFAIGFAACIPVLLLAFAGIDWVERQIRKRRRYPAANAVRTLDAALESGRRVSARNLLGWRLPGKRSYLLFLLKQGPNEPTAGRPASPTFNEPLDDEPASSKGSGEGQ